MKYRCTLIIDLEIPTETEEDAANIFLGVVGPAVASSRLFPQESIKLIKHEAEKITDREIR